MDHDSAGQDVPRDHPTLEFPTAMYLNLRPIGQVGKYSLFCKIRKLPVTGEVMDP